MSENTIVEVDGQLDAFTGEVVESETELTLETIVQGLTDQVFGKSETISPYKIAKVVNLVFQATGTSKQIPPQMMYIYAGKGMIAGKGSAGRKEYTVTEVTTWVLKYTSKHVEI